MSGYSGYPNSIEVEEYDPAGNPQEPLQAYGSEYQGAYAQGAYAPEAYQPQASQRPRGGHSSWTNAVVTTGRYANHQPLARRNLPVTVVNSYEWQTRCNGRREFLRRGPEVAKLFALAVDKRREQLAPFRNPIPGNRRFDMAY